MPQKNFPHELKQLLELECIVACGWQIGTDCNWLEKLGIVIPN